MCASSSIDGNILYLTTTDMFLNCIHSRVSCLSARKYIAMNIICEMCKRKDFIKCYRLQESSIHCEHANNKIMLRRVCRAMSFTIFMRVN